MGLLSNAAASASKVNDRVRCVPDAKSRLKDAQRTGDRVDRARKDVEDAKNFRLFGRT